MILSSWGRLRSFKTNNQLIFEGKKDNLTIGNLRSYGDQAYNHNVNLTFQNNRILSFNQNKGLISCESGLLINDLCDVIHKFGFTLPVVPGSGFVTIGGAVSNDIHGKSHHINGSIGNHVANLSIFYKGKILNCSPFKNKELFSSIIAGMGLLGEIKQVTLKLSKIKKVDYLVECVAFKTLDNFFTLSNDSNDYSDTVAWFDCTNKNNRGVFFRATRSQNIKKEDYKKNKISYPFNHSFSLINKVSIFLFNKVYFYMHLLKQKKITSFDQHHHPLDKIKDWNKIYGSKGFYQFQGVIPKKYAREGIYKLLEIIRVSGQGSFLSVLKNFGPIRSVGYLSFPIEGTTIAIDFPNQGAKTEKLIHNLYNIVISYNGKIYPAKDSLMTSKQFRSCYPNFKKFLKLRDPYIQSEMSRRYKI